MLLLMYGIAVLLWSCCHIIVMVLAYAYYMRGDEPGQSSRGYIRVYNLGLGHIKGGGIRNYSRPPPVRGV